METSWPQEVREFVCRGCLSKNTSMRNIYIEKIIDLPLSTILMECTSLHMYMGDKLPPYICEACFEELIRWVRFKRRCRESDVILRKPIKEEGAEPVIPEADSAQSNSLNTYYSLQENVSIKAEPLEIIEPPEKLEPIEVLDEPIEVLDEPIEVPDEPKTMSSLLNRRKKILTKSPNQLAKKIMSNKFRTVLVPKTNLESIPNFLSAVKVHVCPSCNKTFNQKYKLMAHYKVHIGEKAFKCEVCSKSFAVRSQLKEHSMTHLSERPFKCELCPKSYSFKYRLDCHMKFHAGVRPHKCEYCEQAFFQKSHLVDHRRTHTGEKPFACAVCGKSYAQKSHMKAHAKSHQNS